MKKILLSACLVCIALSSCRKNYACTCTVTSGGQTVEHEYPLTNVKKKEAKKKCDDVGVTWVNQGGSCDLTKVK